MLTNLRILLKRRAEMTIKFQKARNLLPPPPGTAQWFSPREAGMPSGRRSAGYYWGCPSCPDMTSSEGVNALP